MAETFKTMSEDPAVRNVWENRERAADLMNRYSHLIDLMAFNLEGRAVYSPKGIVDEVINRDEIKLGTKDEALLFGIALTKNIDAGTFNQLVRISEDRAALWDLDVKDGQYDTNSSATMTVLKNREKAVELVAHYRDIVDGLALQFSHEKNDNKEMLVDMATQKADMVFPGGEDRGLLFMIAAVKESDKALFADLESRAADKIKKDAILRKFKNGQGLG
ncbi:MAG: hypothetical protein FWD15_04580 [Alphaproteobacteria bacterium]|nr:hypothetical protein [Alphaproteobacteria bacterium]